MNYDAFPQSPVSRRGSSDMSTGKPAKFMPVLRTTSSNSNVVSKTAREARTEAQSMEPKTSGVPSDEDDSMERDVAMSSPMKGEEYRKSVQVRFRFVSFKYTALLLDIGEAQRWRSNIKACD
jgi:hypothetical protein